MTCLAQTAGSGGEAKYRDPKRLENEIVAFEAADRKSPPPPGAVVCIGSSSMGGWHDAIHKDLAPLTIIARGFGGSNMNDALHYADRIVLPYKPRAVVLYEGDNDIGHGEAGPRTVAALFRAFVDKVHKELPECRIYFLSIKPSIKRWTLWPRMQEANRLIAAQCAGDKRLTYIDLSAGMLDDEGKPREDMFLEDKLHMTRPGYEAWRDAVRPVLLKFELSFEPQP